MKFLSTLILTILLTPLFSHAQHGFISQYLGGSFETVDLNTASRTVVGTTISNLAASDLGPNGVLYGIANDNFYQIDTTDGSYTLISAITPPTNHVWTGMAYDNADDVMYAYSSYGIAAGEGSLHIVDLATGAYTLVGTQTFATAIACIAIDATNGQMYGVNSAANGKLIAIDKTDGSALQIGTGLGVGVAGMGQGMDFDDVNSIMYFTNYNSLNFVNTLRTVDLVNGTSAEVGDIGNWVGTIAIPGTLPLSADFGADNTDICLGGTVNFTDMSTNATSWSWTFEGGTPATSTNQNPTVIYNATGVFDVTLVVSDGTDSDTKEVLDMISVEDVPAQPDTPSGPLDACNEEAYTYATLAVDYASSYVWEVLPADAGTITGSDTSAVFESAASWTGAYTIKVKATGNCGTSPWSTELNCTLNETPLPFTVSTGGGYCQGGDGIEVILDGSETGVDYELFLDDISTGIIEPGTGNAINFGYQTTEGTYTVTGHGSLCSKEMYGGSYIFVLYLPGQGTQPTGPEEVCAGSITDYQTTAIYDADTLIWVLDPTDAGMIMGGGENISIEWSVTYVGLAYLSVYGSNECGDGPASNALEINVGQLPQPEITGENLVCVDHENIYSTTDNAGSTYSWEVVGGEIVSISAVTSEITVLWTVVGDGYMLVTETIADNCEGTSDTLQITIDDCIGIGESSINTVAIYPNPAKDQITISAPSLTGTSFDLRIYNQFGQLVYTEENIPIAGQGTHQIHTASLAGGLYVVKMISTANQLYHSRFEVLR